MEAPGNVRHDFGRAQRARAPGPDHVRRDGTAARGPAAHPRRGRAADRRGGGTGRGPQAALRAADRPRHVRQRGAVRQVPAGDPARPAVRADLHVHHDRLRGPARPHRRAGRHRQPVRRLAGPGGVHQGGPGGGRHHARRDQQPSLAARGGLRVPHRHHGGPGEGAAGHQDVHRLAAGPLPVSSRACAEARGAPCRRPGEPRRPGRCRNSPRRSSAARTRSAPWRPATASPSAW
ncbi:hypothetical protein QFZ82_002851 [Streptomyces sp. V4I23]|nr:hypothetical protein [Streptomyces sp. V4I23]